MTREIEILDMSSPDFAEQFRKAINLKPGQTLQITGPQFKREDGITPVANPAFDLLKNLSKETLIALGMRNWDNRLWLFPYEWFSLIPKEFLVTCIDGSTSKWGDDPRDDDHRAGVLAYGIVPKFAASNIAED